MGLLNSGFFFMVDFSYGGDFWFPAKRGAAPKKISESSLEFYNEPRKIAVCKKYQFLYKIFN